MCCLPEPACLSRVFSLFVVAWLKRPLAIGHALCDQMLTGATAHITLQTESSQACHSPRLTLAELTQPRLYAYGISPAQREGAVADCQSISFVWFTGKSKPTLKSKPPGIRKPHVMNK